MSTKSALMWSMAEFVEEMKKRQMNEFDVNIGVSGKRGDGKSTFLLKFFMRFKGYKPWTHQVYTRKAVLDLLQNQQLKFCWDDEAINSGYKRDFASKAQHELIKTITMYRDNFNIYASAIPFFYSLDKDLRELIFVHIHIIERGLAVIFMPIAESLHSSDPWDSKNNSKLEEKWQRKKAEDSKFRFPYHKMSTFAGYIRFTDITEKQRVLYKEIKLKKRSDALQSESGDREEELDFVDKVYNQVVEYKLNKSGFIALCNMEDRKYSTMISLINKRLKDAGIEKTLMHFLTLKENQEKKEVSRLRAMEQKALYYQRNKKRLLAKKRFKEQAEAKKQQISKDIEEETKGEMLVVPLVNKSNKSVTPVP